MRLLSTYLENLPFGYFEFEPLVNLFGDFFFLASKWEKTIGKRSGRNQEAKGRTGRGKRALETRRCFIEVRRDLQESYFTKHILYIYGWEYKKSKITSRKLLIITVII